MAERNRVLVVDDDEGVREYVEAVLSRAGLEVVCAPDGARGLQALDERSPDLVLLELSMPDASGIDLLRRIKQRDEHLPVVMLSGQGAVANVVESLRNGAADFLSKPCEPEQLASAVERVLALGRRGQLCPTCNGNGWLLPDGAAPPTAAPRHER